jgi:hypothetical protein
MPGSKHKLSKLNLQVDQKCTMAAGIEFGIAGIRLSLNVNKCRGTGRAGSSSGELRVMCMPVENEGRASDFCEYRYSLRKLTGHIRYARFVVPAGQGASGRDRVNICSNSGLGYRC